MILPESTGPPPAGSLEALIRGTIPLAKIQASAVSRDLFCNHLLKMLGVLTVEIGTDPIDEFDFTQEAVWFDDSPLGVNPMRFEAIQPGTLDRQLTDDERPNSPTVSGRF